MAQTKKKRSTKHRGNAAGIVENRGRTGRKPADSERKPTAKQVRADRLNRPPSWSRAFNQSMIVTALFVGVLVLFLHQKARPMIELGAVLVVFYTPMTYFTDRWLNRRHLAKQAAGGQG